MMQDFLKMVGDCIEHESTHDESASAEIIYDHVMRKIALCEKRRKRKKILCCAVGGLAVAAAIFCLLVLPENGNGESDRVTQKQEKNHGAMGQERVVFCVYEAGKGEQKVTADYMSAMKKREVKKEKEIEMGTYNPLTSTVPGYPVLISSSKNEDMDAEFFVTTSDGQLVQWDQETGEVREFGKKGVFAGGEKIFWSPLNDGKPVEKSTIKVRLSVMGQLEDNIEVEITKRTENGYKAKRIR